MSIAELTSSSSVSCDSITQIGLSTYIDLPDDVTVSLSSSHCETHYSHAELGSASILQTLKRVQGSFFVQN